MQPWEASPYGNVHTYNHDILPASAALGINGCTDCHHPRAEFFFASSLRYRFDEDAQPVAEPQYRTLGLSLPAVTLGVWREAYLKPLIYALIVVLVLSLILLAGDVALRWTFAPHRVPAAVRFIPALVVLAGVIGALMLVGERPATACCPSTAEFMLTSRFVLDSNHFAIAVAVLIVGVIAMLWETKRYVPDDGLHRTGLGTLTGIELAVALLLALVSGALIFLKIPALASATRYAYTVFDVAVALILLGTIASVLRQACRLMFRPTGNEAAAREAGAG